MNVFRINSVQVLWSTLKYYKHYNFSNSSHTHINFGIYTHVFENMPMNSNNLYIAQLSFLSDRSRIQIVFDINRVKCKPKHWPGAFLVEISIIKVSVCTVSTESAEIICLAHRSVKLKEISKLCLTHVLHTEKIIFLNMEKYNS